MSEINHISREERVRITFDREISEKMDLFNSFMLAVAVFDEIPITKLYVKLTFLKRRSISQTRHKDIEGSPASPRHDKYTPIAIFRHVSNDNLFFLRELNLFLNENTHLFGTSLHKISICVKPA